MIKISLLLKSIFSLSLYPLWGVLEEVSVLSWKKRLKVEVMMLRKILIGVLSGVVVGGIIAACDRPEKKTSSTSSSSVEEAKSTESQVESRSEEKKLEAAAQRKRFAQRLRVKTPIRTLQVGQVVTIPVEVTNLGPEPWLTDTSPSGERPVKLWYHWIDWTPETPAVEGQESTAVEEQASPAVEEQKKNPQRTHQLRPRLPRRTNKLRKEGKVVEFGGMRTPVPHVINPMESASIEATVKAPSRPGSFVLRLTMMRGGEGSFENKGGKPLDLPVTVTQ
jgi:hypothetical protein